ncbi:helix-turn-helix domain-containing protein [Chitinophaga sp. sic0106]|uniref:winged helix-turn-helix transcriptional regulator n=1 Tax=Chitinophaga sp. sic0106 TaxID=2854785 RepID=UPI001C48D1E4|nr:helix-turn-helix domain-containing protein [Chitinophaga sp. sic0106]MBV7531720.1 helix-turn-helix transcriptional regulator [Chitinophaga sp. sic0106]
MEHLMIPPEDPACLVKLRALRDGLEILGGKWKLLIVQYLANRQEQTNHFKKMQRELEGISAKMLTKELRDLEVNKIVKRTVMDTRPVVVAYALTSYGRSVLPVADVLIAWGMNHRKEILG